MFSSIGWGEIVVLALAALFIFGPERLPGLAKDAAAGLSRARTAMTGAREQLHDTLGPDFDVLRDLDLRRFHPKTLLREELLGADDGQSASRDARIRTLARTPVDDGVSAAEQSAREPQVGVQPRHPQEQGKRQVPRRPEAPTRPEGLGTRNVLHNGQEDDQHRRSGDQR